jgi:hypothetical protein
MRIKRINAEQPGFARSGGDGWAYPGNGFLSLPAHDRPAGSK